MKKQHLKYILVYWKSEQNENVNKNLIEKTLFLLLTYLQG